MKQRPVFILLTFFLSLASVILITFVFLRTQLSEHKLQNIVEETIYKNFPDFKVKVDQIGLNLGTKFRYKIAKIKIEYKNEMGIFSSVELNNISIKFPLFFLLGKQDIDISIENISIDKFNFKKWMNNNYKFTYLSVDSLKIPKFLIDNRINLTIGNIIYENEVESWPSPLQIKSISHLVIKDFSISDKTAIEFSAVAQSRQESMDPLVINFVSIGHIRLGQFVSSGVAESKLLLEIKSVNKPEYSWLTNHRLQYLDDILSDKSFLYVHGNAIEGKTEIRILPGAMSFDDIDFEFKTDEIIKESSILKNTLFLLSETLDLRNFNKTLLESKGHVSYVQLEEGNNSSWIFHLSNRLFNNESKVDIEIDSTQSSHTINLKSGSDLSYRKVDLVCLQLDCFKNNLKSIEVNFYNQILQNNEKISLIDLMDNFSSWWSNLIPLLSDSKTTPFKVFWKKNRWNDFEFDLHADVAMNNSVLASDNIVIKKQGKEVVEAKFSLTNGENSLLTSRMIFQLNNFPSSVMAKFFPDAQIEMSGTAKGEMALEFTSAEKRISADVDFADGYISWLNFDDLFRRSIFLKPEDEIKHQGINWNPDFVHSNMLVQWTEQSKTIDFDILKPIKSSKKIKLKIDTLTKEVSAEVNFNKLAISDKKYLENTHDKKIIDFVFFYLPDELKSTDKKVSNEVEQ